MFFNEKLVDIFSYGVVFQNGVISQALFYEHGFEAAYRIAFHAAHRTDAAEGKDQFRHIDFMGFLHSC